MTHVRGDDVGLIDARWTNPLRLNPPAVWAGLCVLMLLGVLVQEPLPAEDIAPKPTAQKPDVPESVSKRRLGIMQAAIDSFSTKAEELKTDDRVQLGDKPVLRYDDQARNLLDAGVWRIGEKGRPTAFVTIELYGVGEDQALLTYEFISLTPKHFSMISTNGPAWTPKSTDMAIQAIPEAPRPADSQAARLTQMRDIARDFHAVQTYRGEKIELRLLPQPIDRYSDKDHAVTDGTIFVFANGTNPEMGLLIESDGKSWNYGLFRMSTAPIAVDYGKKALEGIPPNAAYGVSRAYTATRHGVTLPK